MFKGYTKKGKRSGRKQAHCYKILWALLQALWMIDCRRRFPFPSPFRAVIEYSCIND